ncbi:aldo/keto reductase [Sedimentisphaera salicampi]|uniref:L-glyceraldehyde 3-phosphate reductase n=1 Tax=Sedimentisphaera salicampi TaxID=1941349 RepID=A0A1W6LIS0_9BACT|nr:aldo/keto reductase [Sedimentisphaera salicampi]ARN55688.1 L-glyceraldehyde 3-phosphate reductase [Sedimentisphaera salicampi]
MTDFNRRNFIKAVGAAGVAGTSYKVYAEPKDKKDCEKKGEEKKSPVLQRTLGKTGLKVPTLAPGIMYNAVNNQSVLLASAMKGANYWDTAHGYAGGNSELGIGKFFERKPELRKKIIIASKASGARDNAGRDDRLQTSFKRMNTDYIDIYYGIHAMSRPEQLTDELKEWAQKAKEEKKIKFFGITTHSNIEECLHACAESGYIDAIMCSYNFKLMQQDKMNKAVEAANKAGIGLVAMKVMARNADIEKDDDKNIASQFLEKGMTPAQAKIKAILSDDRFASACVGMKSVKEFSENLKAVLRDEKLSFSDHQKLGEIAKANCDGYCAGCSEICSKASGNPYIADAMRALMYNDSYGEHEMAVETFSEIPTAYRQQFASADFSAAERACPNNIPITELVSRAADKLA